MSDYQVKDFIDLVNQNPKEVLFALINDQDLRDRVKKLVNMCDIGQDLDTPHSFEELSMIYDYTKDIRLKSEDYALADIQYFAAKAINYNMPHGNPVNVSIGIVLTLENFDPNFSFMNILPYNFHCWGLLIIFLISILTGVGRKYETE